MEQQRVYLAIDLKSFYASVECVDRGLDPLSTNLVVADASRTEKTICLAVSPSLKAYRIPGRARLFEVVQRTKEVNAQRLQAAIRQRRAVRRENGSYDFLASSSDAARLNADPSLRLDYIVAPPRMARYLQVSEQINKIYLRYVAPEDIHPYSIDEVFMDVTSYLPLYKLTAHELAMKLVREVLAETGITATAGIGTNLYLAKLAMDIVAKHIPPDADGVRIAQLDEESFRYLLWDHRPMTDFWMTGPRHRAAGNAHEPGKPDRGAEREAVPPHHRPGPHGAAHQPDGQPGAGRCRRRAGGLVPRHPEAGKGKAPAADHAGHPEPIRQERAAQGQQL